MREIKYLLFAKETVMHIRPRFVLAAVTSVLLVVMCPINLKAQYYKCIGEDGVHIYTNTGCPIDAENQRFVMPESENKKSADKQGSDSKAGGDSEYPYNGYENGGLVGLQILTEGYRLSPGERSQIERGINFILGYYKQVFNYNEDVPVRIRIFGKKGHFMSYQEELSPVVSEVGFYSPMYNEAVVNGDRDKNEVIATIYHEANHSILTQKAPELPLWINEGLAEYFERIIPEDESVTVGHQDSRYYKLRQDLKSRKLPGLSSYLGSWDSALKRDGQVQDDDARSVAWSLVHYLMSTQEGQDTVIRLLREKNETPSVSSSEIIDEYYPGGLAALERNWLTYIKQSPTLHVYEPFN
jgi:Protein of unknown function (DUF1570)